MQIENPIKMNVDLPKGGTLELELTDKFLQVVRDQFMLQTISEVKEEHIRMYIWGAFKNALDKAELG
jgi:hypothetical protein